MKPMKSSGFFLFGLRETPERLDSKQMAHSYGNDKSKTTPGPITYGMISPPPPPSPEGGECVLAAVSRTSLRLPVMYTLAPLAAKACVALRGQSVSKRD